MKTVGSTPVTQSSTTSASALIANAQLQASIPVTAEPAAAPVRDKFEQARATDDASPSNNAQNLQRSEGANPFNALERRADSNAAKLGDAANQGNDLDVSQDHLGQMNTLLAGLAGRDRGLPTKALTGFMMLTHDAQHASPGAGAKDALTKFVQAVLNKELTAEGHKTFWRTMGVTKESVNAMIQRVLRESYMLSNESMFETARRLQSVNDLRKKIRDELKNARETQSAWLQQAKGDENWSASTPYAALQVNSALYDLQPDLLNEEELALHKETLASQASENEGANFAGMMAQLEQPSGLTVSQRIKLNEVLEGNDDSVKEAMALIKECLGAMNGEDLKRYIEPFLDKLNRGNTDEAEIRDLFQAMSPAQFLTVIADGYTASKFEFGTDDARKFRELTALRLSENLGDVSVDEKTGNLLWRPTSSEEAIAVTSNAKLQNRSDREDSLKEAKTNQIQADDARRILDAWKAERTPVDNPTNPDQAASDGTAVGSQRMLSTAKDIEGYIEDLENQLNSVGEDAQLMNADLQNQLQRAQQTMQMMSNMSKVMHETAMAVIRNTNS